MATSIATVCFICEARHLTKYAEHWCPECAEGLCSECLEHHSLSKATRGPELVSIENYKKLPTFIANITDVCKEHATKCSHFCQYHDQLCCPVCITTNHKACIDLHVLTDVIRNSKTSTLISVLEEQLNRMLSFIDRGMKDREENISTLKEDRQQILDKIKQIRNKINSHLDTLEQTILEELTGNHKTNSLDIQATVEKLSEKSNEIKQLRNSLMATKEYGSDLQAFFGARKIDDEVNKVDEYLKSTTEKKYFRRIKMVGNINHEIADVYSLTSFGKIDVEFRSSSLEYKAKEEHAAQVSSVGKQMTPKSIHDIKLKSVSTFSITSEKNHNFFRGCTVTEDGEMIFTDNYNHRLVFINIDNPYYRKIMLPSTNEVYDVTVIDQHRIAVSTGEGIKIIDVDTEKNVEDIKTDRTPFGITYHKGSLMWCEKHQGIKKMMLHDKVVSTILKRKLPSHSFLKAYDDKLYLSDSVDRTVECFSLDGRRDWKFKDRNEMLYFKDATYIAVGNNTFVYTTSKDSNDVVVISPDGKQSRKLLSSKDGLCLPKGICFDIKRNNLFLVNTNGTVFIYHVD